jgi:hypothetical protein
MQGVRFVDEIDRCSVDRIVLLVAINYQACDVSTQICTAFRKLSPFCENAWRLAGVTSRSSREGAR